MQTMRKYVYNERKVISIIISNILGLTAVYKQQLIVHYTKDTILDFLLLYMKKWPQFTLQSVRLVCLWVCVI